MFQLSDEDELLFLAMHGVRHGFDKLTYILDVALACEKAGAYTSEVPPRSGSSARSVAAWLHAGPSFVATGLPHPVITRKR